ncbi:MAG: LapA family protein [Polyangiaceae bacterium]|nr:LapA family protein [Polyangiaceae bacterium]
MKLPIALTITLMTQLGSSSAWAQPPTNDERAIHAEIDRLEDEKADNASLGGPITIMAIGGGALAIGTGIALSYATLQSANNIVAYDDLSYQQSYTGGIVVGAVTATIGAGMVLGGGFWLRSRIRKRKKYNRQIESLERELEYSNFEVRFTPVITQTFQGAAIHGTF